MKKINIPCEDCITFVRCRDRILSGNTTHIQYQNLISHMIMCSRLNDFISGRKPYDGDSFARGDYTLKFFKGEELIPSGKKPTNIQLFNFLNKLV
jgi:hypothetical protein